MDDKTEREKEKEKGLLQIKAKKELHKRYKTALKQKAVWKLSVDFCSLASISKRFATVLSERTYRRDLWELWCDRRFRFGFPFDMQLLSCFVISFEGESDTKRIALLDRFLQPQSLFDPFLNEQNTTQFNFELIKFYEFDQKFGKERGLMPGLHQPFVKMPYFFTLYFYHFLEAILKSDHQKEFFEKLSPEVKRDLNQYLIYLADISVEGLTDPLRWFISFVEDSLYLLKGYLGKDNLEHKKACLNDLYKKIWPSLKEQESGPVRDLIESSTREFFLEGITSKYVLKFPSVENIFQNLPYEKRILCIWYSEKILNCKEPPFTNNQFINKIEVLNNEDFYLSDIMPVLNEWVNEKYKNQVIELSDWFAPLFKWKDGYFKFGGGPRALLWHILFWTAEQYENTAEFLNCFAFILGNEDLFGKIYKSYWNKREAAIGDKKNLIMTMLSSEFNKAKSNCNWEYRIEDCPDSDSDQKDEIILNEFDIKNSSEYKKELVSDNDDIGNNDIKDGSDTDPEMSPLSEIEEENVVESDDEKLKNEIVIPLLDDTGDDSKGNPCSDKQGSIEQDRVFGNQGNAGDSKQVSSDSLKTSKDKKASGEKNRSSRWQSIQKILKPLCNKWTLGLSVCLVGGVCFYRWCRSWLGTVLVH